MGRYKGIKKATAEVVGFVLVRKSSTAKAHEAIRDVIVANPAFVLTSGLRTFWGAPAGWFTKWRSNSTFGDQGRG